MEQGTGVTYATGFTAGGVACGIKKGSSKDLAVVYCERLAKASGVFTKNIVKGHSLQLSHEHVSGGIAQAVVINSGNANACLAERGRQDAQLFSELTAQRLSCSADHVLPASTGVIGVPLPMDKIKYGLSQIQLSKAGAANAAEAIMTTDTFPKQAMADAIIGGRDVRIGGMAKGSGMIHPDMATMIAVITTDANITTDALRAALKSATDVSFNRISVDGDTSVCDKVLLLSSCMAGNNAITEGSADYDLFLDALTIVCTDLSKMLAADGEGATKLLTINIVGTRSNEDAHKIANAVAKSPLCKTAAFGKDANWGRLLTAAGYSGAQFDLERVNIYIGDVQVCENGGGLYFDEEAALEVLEQDEVVYTLEFGDGDGTDKMWTCDLSVDYVHINANYRT